MVFYKEEEGVRIHLSVNKLVTFIGQERLFYMNNNMGILNAVPSHICIFLGNDIKESESCS